MFYTVYKTTNLINGKFYIGTHKTSDPNDSYLGSGKLLKKAIEKYGTDWFEKEVLFVFDKPEAMFAKEAEIVTAEFLAENNTYNLKLGGEGGFDWINSQTPPEVKAQRNQAISESSVHKLRTPEFRKRKSETVREKIRSGWKPYRKEPRVTDEMIKERILLGDSKRQIAKNLGMSLGTSFSKRIDTVKANMDTLAESA